MLCDIFTNSTPQRRRKRVRKKLTRTLVVCPDKDIADGVLPGLKVALPQGSAVFRYGDQAVSCRIHQEIASHYIRRPYSFHIPLAPRRKRKNFNIASNN